MMRIIYIITCLLFVREIVSSCSNKRVISGLENFIQLSNSKSDIKIYIIPGSGCTGCITGMESMAQEYKNSDSVYFVFTRLTSLKAFKLKFKDLLNGKNIIIDSINKFEYLDKKYEIYPVQYEKKGGDISFVEYLKP